MSTLSLRLPNSIHRQLRDLAQKEGVSINQLINSAVAEKVSALLTVDYLEARAEQGSRAAFDGVLERVPDSEPVATDTIE
jgi:predicted transcriptional regulator